MAMYYILIDSTGNLIESYASEAEARVELDAIVAAEPEAANDVMLITYDAAGKPVGDAVTASAPVIAVSASVGEQGTQPVYGKVVKTTIAVGGAAQELPGEPDNEAGPVLVSA